MSEYCRVQLFYQASETPTIRNRARAKAVSALVDDLHGRCMGVEWDGRSYGDSFCFCRNSWAIVWDAGKNVLLLLLMMMMMMMMMMMLLVMIHHEFMFFINISLSSLGSEFTKFPPGVHRRHAHPACWLFHHQEWPWQGLTWHDTGTS